MTIVRYESKRGPVAYSLREHTAADVPFIMSAWKAYLLGAPILKWTRAQVEVHERRVLVPLLDRCGALMATAPDQSELYVGCAIGEQQGDDHVLHFLYVKDGLRGFGIGRRLMRAACPTVSDVFVSHPSRALPALIRKWGGLVFDPYRAFGWAGAQEQAA